MNGLLGMGQQGAPMGGLLGGGMPQNMPQGGGNVDPMRLLMMLSQSPSAETVENVIQIMSESGRPEAKDVIEILNKLETPDQIKEFADQIIKQKSGA